MLNTDGWVGTLGADGNRNIPAILNVGDPNPANWTWEPLHDAEYCSQPYLEDQCNPGAPNQFDLDLYPFMFLLSSGKVLMAGSQYLSTDPNNASDFASSRLLSVGLGQWDGAFQPSSTILGGSAAMFSQDKVLKAGGATSVHNSGCEHSPPTAAAYFIDMSQLNPAWTQTSDMYHPRINHGLVNLPNGQVLAVGRSKDLDDSCAAAGGALEPEMWNPLTGNWTRMVPMPSRARSTRSNCCCPRAPCSSPAVSTATVPATRPRTRNSNRRTSSTAHDPASRSCRRSFITTRASTS
ncbi:MAG: hypothetical protein HRF50_17025 [Phycisphaerae bacterium]